VAETTIDYTEGNTTTTKTRYLVRSSVLKGQVLTEMSETGQKQRTFVYLGKQVLAIQRQATDNTQSVVWEHRDSGNASYRVTGSDGTIHTTGSAELDPLGTDAGTSNPRPLFQKRIRIPCPTSLEISRPTAAITVAAWRSLAASSPALRICPAASTCET
jgi:hypothetical protein